MCSSDLITTNLYDVCRYLTFVVDVEIDVVTFCRGEMTTPGVVTFLTFVEPTTPKSPFFIISHTMVTLYDF